MTTHDEYERIADYIRSSDLPRREAKLDGLRLAAHRRIPMTLARDPETGEPIILVDGIAIDPSELDNGHWL